MLVLKMILFSDKKKNEIMRMILSLTKMSHKLAVACNFGGSDAKSESDRICDLISEFYDCRYNVGF